MPDRVGKHRPTCYDPYGNRSSGRGSTYLLNFLAWIRCLNLDEVEPNQCRGTLQNPYIKEVIIA